MTGEIIAGDPPEECHIRIVHQVAVLFVKVGDGEYRAERSLINLFNMDRHDGFSPVINLPMASIQVRRQFVHYRPCLLVQIFHR